MIPYISRITRCLILSLVYIFFRFRFYITVINRRLVKYLNDVVLTYFQSEMSKTAFNSIKTQYCPGCAFNSWHSIYSGTFLERQNFLGEKLKVKRRTFLYQIWLLFMKHALSQKWNTIPITPLLRHALAKHGYDAENAITIYLYYTLT